MGPGGKWIEGINPDGNVQDAARLSLEARLMAVAHHLPLAAYHAVHDVEHVHRLRVSTRRAMATLELYRDWLPGKQARWLKKRLKRIRRTAGKARDLDVLAERLSGEYGDGAATIIAKIAKERSRVQPDIVRLAERMRRGDRFVRKTAKLVQGIRRRNTPHDAPHAESFRAWAQGQLSQFAQQFFSAQPPAEADMAALHRFRIRAKALRYALEALAPAFEPELRNVHYREIEELQERLGKINDRVTARYELRAWSAESANAKDRDLFCDVADREVAHLTDELSEFKEWWTPQRADRLREGMNREAGAAGVPAE